MTNEQKINVLKEIAKNEDLTEKTRELVEFCRHNRYVLRHIVHGNSVDQFIKKVLNVRVQQSRLEKINHIYSKVCNLDQNTKYEYVYLNELGEFYPITHMHINSTILNLQLDIMEGRVGRWKCKYENKLKISS